MSLRVGLLAVTALAGLGLAGPANASLSLFQQFSGLGVGVSTDGCGSTTQTCTLLANLPTGATATAAFLYSSLFDTTTTPGGTLAVGLNPSTNLVYTPLPIGGGSFGLRAWRSDVSSYVLPLLATGANNLTVTETQGVQDGEALVVIYSNPSKPTSSVIIVDGGSSSTGDTSTISTAPFTTGEMRIGDGFSFDGPNPTAPSNTGQVSSITVNGNLLTGVAGHCDDAQDASCANGNLITVGADGDPFTPFPNPTIGQDHERYDLANVVLSGATSIKVDTVNPSGDDNIFLEVFALAGAASIQTPEPASLALLGVGLLGLGLIRSRKRS